MYKYLILSSLVVLSGCTFGKNEAPAPTPAPTENNTGVSTTPVNAVVSLNYTLREGSPTGTILETTKEDVAKENNLYQSGTNYVPFEVILGTNAVIPGFEAGIASMKKGESKMIEVLPKDGYGEATATRMIQKAEVAPAFSITTDRSRFEDMIVQTVERKALGDQGLNLTVGQTLTGGADVKATVKKIEGENITLAIENKENPFYGKKLAVGATAQKEKISFTITALTDTEVTLDIVNGDSPFTNKEFVAGASAEIPGQDGQPSPGTIKILSISGEEVNIEMPNTHPLAGKTLYFDVEVLDIK
jgi:FKBP-type peptidyl-prolyl cis-trans isomerase 2